MFFNFAGMKEELNNEFKINFDGETSKVDANTLINSLIHITNIIQEINAETNIDTKIEIKIKALEKGSFFIHIELLSDFLDTLKNIFTEDNIKIGGSIIAIFKGLFELHKFLKSKKPNKVESNGNEITITNCDGNISIFQGNTYNIYVNNPVIPTAIPKCIKTIEQDPAITTFEITNDKDEPIFKVEREDFEIMSVENEVIEKSKQEIVKQNVRLNIIKKISFDKKDKWDFYYEGNKISAKINDELFWQQIENRELLFGKGDVLVVNLEIQQEFDDEANTFINKAYLINKFIKHIPKPKQEKLSFKDNKI